MNFSSINSYLKKYSEIVFSESSVDDDESYNRVFIINPIIERSFIVDCGRPVLIRSSNF